MKMFSFNTSSLLPISTLILYAVICVLLTIVLLFLFVLFKKRLTGRRMRMMGIWIGVMVIVSLILFSTGFFGSFVDVSTADSRQFSRNALIEDLQQVENCIINENPLYFADRDELKNRFADAYDKIEDGMTELEFYRLINPLVVSVKCGHTNLSISEALQKNREATAKYFPLEVTLVNNELYVMEDDQTSGIRAGDRIKAINGKTGQQIIDVLINNISADGESKTKQRYIISRHFNSRFYDFVDNSDVFQVKYMDKTGDIKNTELSGKYRSEYNTSAWGLHFSDYQDGNYYESEIYDNYAVLTIRVFMPERGEDFASFLDTFFLKLKEEDISRLIIDLRGNVGGSPQMAKALLSHLVSKETEYFTDELPFLQDMLGFTRPILPAESVFDGKLGVLIDGADFSTTGHLVALLKYHKLGTLIGTETAGTYVCTDSSKDTILQNTRMRLHYSTLVYQVAAEGFSANEGIKPDIQVRSTIDSILDHQDLQLQRGLQLLGVD